MTTYWLQITRGSSLTTKLRLVDTRYLLGRSAECDIILQGRGVSRRHAELLCRGDHWSIRDLESRNGIALNGARIAGEQRLEAGDTVRLDCFELVLYRELAVAVEEDALTRTSLDLAPPRPTGGYLSTLVAFNGALLATESRQQRRSLLCQLLIGPELGASSAQLLTLRRDDPECAPTTLGEPVVAAGKRAPVVSRLALTSVLAGHEIVLTSARPTYGQADERDAEELEAVLAVSLVADEDKLEVLYATLPDACGSSEWRTMVTTATAFFRQAEDVWTARQAARRQAQLGVEIERAHDLQRRLVPSNFRSGRIDIAFGFEPCKGVGGDYIDAVPMTDGRVLLVAMDVAGKGMDAALIASGLHTTVHICAMQWFTLIDMIKTLNRYLIATWDVMTSVTVAASILDPRSGVIESINCSHPAPVIVTSDGRLRELATFETVPLGFMELEIATRTDRLRPGELLAYFSDGLTELFDEHDDMLGVEGVAAHLSALRGSAETGVGAATLVDRLSGRLAEFRGQAAPSDDISFVLALARP